MIGKEIKKDAEAKMKKAVEAVKREFSEVRTGRAHPGLIEGLHVDYYGTPTLLKSLASISIPDPKTVVIQPWDVSVLPEVERAINSSKLGISPINDGKLVRLIIPALSEERRKELQKVVKDMAEHGRVSLRTIRRDANERVKKCETEKKISEDDSFRLHEEIQKVTDAFIKEMDKILESKSKELAEFN